MELLLILGVILVALFFIFGRKKKPKDKYFLVQERRTEVRNHVIKVPGNKKRSN